MATSSNFGNMFSAAGASAFLSFRPLLPSQILLNNLLYDVGQMSIPTDRVDPEMLARPSQWDVRFIRRFMSFFGPISSIFDFVTFGILLAMLHATHTQFRSGWFVESLVTQSLVIFVIGTRRIPFFHSRPSRPLLIAIVVSATAGTLLPFSPFASALGFSPLPLSFFALLVVLVGLYLTLAELGKYWFYASEAHALTGRAAPRADHDHRIHRIHRRASRFSHLRPHGGRSGSSPTSMRSSVPHRRVLVGDRHHTFDEGCHPGHVGRHLSAESQGTLRDFPAPVGTLELTDPRAQETEP